MSDKVCEKVKPFGGNMPCKRYEEIDTLRRQLGEERERVKELVESSHERMLNWRNIYTENGDKVCRYCRGAGKRLYGNTSTWKRGIGGQAMTTDICDCCWGSGIENRPWFNLKENHKNLTTNKEQ